MHPETQKGIVTGLISAIAFAGMAFLGHAATSGIPQSQVVFSRWFIGVILLLPFTYKEIGKIFSKEAKYIWLRSIAGALSVICFFYNLSQVTMPDAKALSDLAPFFLCTMAWIFLGERLNRTEFIGIALMVTGATTLQSPLASDLPRTVLIVGVIGAFLAGTAYLALRQASQKYSVYLVVFCFSLVGLFTSFFVPGPWAWQGLEYREITWLMLMGLLGLIGQIYLTQSYFHLKASVACALMLSALLWGLVLELIFHDHPHGALSLFSYALIMGGVFILQGKTPIHFRYLVKRMTVSSECHQNKSKP